MIDWITTVGILALGLATMLATYRLSVGPSLPDRLVAMDAVLLNGLGITILLSIRFGTSIYIDVALTIAILFFVCTVAVAKYLLRDQAID